MRFTTSDPRSGGLADQIGAVIGLVSGSTITTLIKAASGDTAWTSVPALLPATPMAFTKCPAVTTDPRSAGRAAQVNEIVLYYTAGIGEYLIKFDTGDTDWVQLPDTTGPGGGGLVADGDKGDITVTGSGVTWTIDNNVVSNAKLRDSGACSVIGRSANSSGDPADISASANASVFQRQGDALLFDTSLTLAGTLTLSPMTSGSVLFAGTGGLVSQDNAGLFYDDSTNALVVGAAGVTKPNTSAVLEVTRTNDTARLLLSSYSATHNSVVYLYRGRGTPGATTAIQSGDQIGAFAFTGATGSGAGDFFDGASVIASATENWGANFGAKLTFTTTQNASGSGGRVARMTIDHDGEVGIGQTTPTERLHVEGSAATGILCKSTAAAAFIEANDAAAKRIRLQANNSGNPFVGVLTNHPLDFQTNNALKATMGTDGSWALNATGNGVFQSMTNGSSAAVSAASTGRIRYNTTGQIFQVSLNGAAYTSLVTGTGTDNILPKWNGTTGALEDSAVTDDGTTVTVGGALSVTGNTTLGNAGTDTTEANLVLVRGNNTNPFSATRRAGLELHLGRDQTDALLSGQTVADLAFQYGGNPGGFRHWIATRHSTAANTTNAIRFFVNTSATAEGSSLPGTGNANVLDLYGDTSARFFGALTVSGAATFSSTANVVGDFSVNTNKFTVAASSGDTVVSGTLVVDGNVTLGNAAGDAHVVTGTVDFNQAVNIDGALVCTSTLQVDGNATLGDSDSADSHVVHGATSIASASANTTTLSYTGTAQTADRSTLVVGNTGTFDCTAAGRIARAMTLSVTATRSAGANNLNNWALSLDASGGQSNHAIRTGAGECLFNITNGASYFGGGVKISSVTVGMTTGATIRAGTGTPEGAVTAGIGSLFLRTDGGAATTLYVKESGTGNTGWVAK